MEVFKLTSSVHIDNKKKDTLILDIGPTLGLDDTMLTAEAEYITNFSRSNIKYCLSLHYNGSNSFLLVNASKIYELKAKDPGIKKLSLCSGNISGDVSDNNMKKTALHVCVYNFFLLIIRLLILVILPIFINI